MVAWHFVAISRRSVQQHQTSCVFTIDSVAKNWWGPVYTESLNFLSNFLTVCLNHFWNIHNIPVYQRPAVYNAPVTYFANKNKLNINTLRQRIRRYDDETNSRNYWNCCHHCQHISSQDLSTCFSKSVQSLSLVRSRFLGLAVLPLQLSMLTAFDAHYCFLRQISPSLNRSKSV